MRKLSVLLALVVLAVLTSLVFAQESVTVDLAELNTSGYSGTATLTAMGAQTEVVIATNAGMVPQPTHIHSGQCGDTLGGVSYALTNVVSGASTTSVDATLSSLLTGDFAINGHESAENIGNYIFCGNIPASALPTTGGVGVGSLVGIVALIALFVLGAGVYMRRRTT